MRDPYGKAVATRAGPESWRAGREGVGRALAGGNAGQPLSSETAPGSGRQPPSLAGKATRCTAIARAATWGPQAIGGTVREGLRPHRRLHRPWCSRVNADAGTRGGDAEGMGYVGRSVSMGRDCCRGSFACGGKVSRAGVHGIEACDKADG